MYNFSKIRCTIKIVNICEINSVEFEWLWGAYKIVADPGFGVPGAPTNGWNFDKVLFVKLTTDFFISEKWQVEAQ